MIARLIAASARNLMLVLPGAVFPPADSIPVDVAASFLAGVVVHLAEVSGMPLGLRRTQGPIEAAVRERHAVHEQCGGECFGA